MTEKIICKQRKNEATSKISHRVNSLICTPNKKRSPLATVDKVWKQILPKQNHLFYSIILCYKGRKNTIVSGGSQFTRYNLSVLSLCVKESPK